MSEDNGPRKGAVPKIGWRPKVDAPWDIIDQLLVLGERITDPATGTLLDNYPAQRQIAERYGVSPATVNKFAKRNNCEARRKQATVRRQEEHVEAIEKHRSKAIEKGLALSVEEEISIIDRYLMRFDEALQEGRVDASNPGDFNIMVRLKRFLSGGADSRAEVHAVVSLEELTRRHKENEERLTQMDPKETGMQYDRDDLSHEDKPRKPFALPPASEESEEYDEVLDVEAHEVDE